MRPARPHCGQEGGNQGFPLLVNQPPSFRARCARKSKSRFPSAARRPQRVSRTGATPEMTRRGRRALRGGVATAILVAFQQLGGGKFGVVHLARAARPYLRQQMPRILGGDLCICSYPKGNGVIRKRGETSFLPSCAPAARSGIVSPICQSEYKSGACRAVAHLPPPRHRLQGKVVFLW